MGSCNGRQGLLRFLRAASRFPAIGVMGDSKLEVMFLLPQAARHPDKECNKSPSFVARQGYSIRVGKMFAGLGVGTRVQVGMHSDGQGAYT